MIRVAAGEREGELILRMEGHANYAPENDIVCAAASMLFFTLVKRMGELGEDFRWESPPSGEGREVQSCANDKTREVWATVCAGFRALGEAYPGYVKALPMKQKGASNG